MLRSDVRRVFDALNDADPATMKAISDWLTGVLSFYRRTDVAIDFPDFPTLQPLLSTYRPLINNTFSNIQLFNPVSQSYEDLSTKITNMEIEGGSRRSLTQLFQDHVHVWSPTVNRTIRHLSTHHPLYSETHHHFSPTTTRHIRHLRVEHPVNFEQHHHYTVKRGSAAAPEYTLDGANGGVVLKKDGVAVSTIQVVPTPVAGTLLAADGSGMHWQSTSAHGTHGGGSGGSADGYIASIDIDTQTGAGLGKITAIRQPGGVAITSAQSTTDIHPTFTQNNTLAVSIQFLTIQNAALSAAVSALTTRIEALENQRLTRSSIPGCPLSTSTRLCSTAVPSESNISMLRRLCTSTPGLPRRILRTRNPRV